MKNPFILNQIKLLNLWKNYQKKFIILESNCIYVKYSNTKIKNKRLFSVAKLKTTIRIKQLSNSISLLNLICTAMS